jgi:hypothetical protein
VSGEQVTAPVATHGEGPVWSEIGGWPRFHDMPAADVPTLSEGVVIRAVRAQRAGT